MKIFKLIARREELESQDPVVYTLSSDGMQRCTATFDSLRQMVCSKLGEKSYMLD